MQRNRRMPIESALKHCKIWKIFRNWYDTIV